MSIYDFYSQFASEGERNPLFTALRKLSRVEDPRELLIAPMAYAEEEDPSAGGWPVWDEGICYRMAGLLFATPA